MPAFQGTFYIEQNADFQEAFDVVNLDNTLIPNLLNFVVTGRVHTSTGVLLVNLTAAVTDTRTILVSLTAAQTLPLPASTSLTQVMVVNAMDPATGISRRIAQGPVVISAE